MATALKDSFPFDIARDLSSAVLRHEPTFPSALFLERAGAGWDDLELMARGERLADTLWATATLPYPRLVGILVQEIGPELERTEENGMAPFRHLPLSYLIARRGLDHLEESLAAMHAVKADGSRKPKVFKLRCFALAPGGAQRLSMSLSFRPMTTRVHYPGRHEVEALVNGVAHPLGSFVVKA